MRLNDAITGTVLVVFAIAEITYTRTFPSLHGQTYGPNLFPMLIGTGLIICGCLLIARGLLAYAKQAKKTHNNVNARWVDFSNIADSNPARINLALTLFFLLLYIFLSETIGFIPLSITTVSILLYRLGSSVFTAATVALATTAVIQILFAKVLLVPLPAGWLQGLVW